MNNITGNKPPPSLILDVKRYEHLLEDETIPQEERQELLDALWLLACEFVMLGYGVHPLQQTESACGKGTENKDQNTVLTLDMLECEDHTMIENFKHATKSETEQHQEGAKHDNSIQ